MAQLLTLPAAARRAGVGLRVLRRARERGELPTYQLGAWPRVRWHDVLLWIAARRRPAQAETQAGETAGQAAAR